VSITEYMDLKRRVIDAGYAAEIDWAHDIKPCPNALEFWREYSWVVINGGMKEQVARIIWEKVRPVVEAGGSASTQFRHAGKTAAIDEVFRKRHSYFGSYRITVEYGVGIVATLGWLEALPWIGPITKYHLAKNLGLDVCKPDRHLVRIFGSLENVTPGCQAIANETGDRLTEVDTVIWRAANLGMI
jgi:hypothetical protein